MSSCRVRVQISSSRYGLFSVVQIFEGERPVLWTTSRPGVQRSDPEVREIVRRYRHQPKAP